MYRRLVLCLLVALLAFSSARAQTVGAVDSFDTKARQIFLIEADTGTILLAKNEDEAVPAASLAKLMTMAVVFNAVKTGEISLDTRYPVSEHAWRTGGAPSRTATMFAALKSSVRVEDLIRGATIQTANDACIILGEGLSGSENAFAERMTREARALGLTTSTFANATGLPDPRNVVTMRELVALAQHLQRNYPDLYRYYSEPEFEWNKIRQRNRNPLIALGIGADGVGLGFSEGHGYAIVASVNRDGKRLFLAMAGLESDKQRVEEARRVIDWAMTSFERKTLFKAGEAVADASVYGGSSSTVPLVTNDDVDVFLPVDNAGKIVARVVYTWPINAPVKPGQEVGVLKIWNDDRLLREVPVHTAGEIAVGTLRSRALDALQELLFFWL
ncbi:MAG: D-alanyl-D-alanine carboxypeptidase family protein [Shinella sp.]|nr:D-alanyl-D-alanine carboxypeptidase family protein [Shinella sp.]